MGVTVAAKMPRKALPFVLDGGIVIWGISFFGKWAICCSVEPVAGCASPVHTPKKTTEINSFVEFNIPKAHKARIKIRIKIRMATPFSSPNNVFVGGIAASLMHKAFLDETRWRGVRFINGLLKEAPAVSLQLDAFEEDLYSEDTSGAPIEGLIPNYSILDQATYKYPVHDAYFAYASRGCVRKCSFCGVPKLEGDQYDVPSLTKIVEGIEKLYGSKKDLVLMDNNVVASRRFKEIIAENRDLGFVPGAKLRRGRSSALRSVDFNQGVDARILCKFFQTCLWRLGGGIREPPDTPTQVHF
jgi:hypothetical protein